METVRECALQWLVVADRLGWGVEGPAHAQAVRARVQQLAQLDNATTSLGLDGERELGVRPVDALTEAADLLVEAVGADGSEGAELLSAARGWLIIAQR